jgi:hypothetical protein
VRFLEFFLGPREIFGPSTPHSRRYWRDVLPAYLDGLARRHLLYINKPGVRLFVKGHFLPSVDTLSSRYPDAIFVTMIRSPSQSIQSMINFMRCAPPEPFVGRLPWHYLRYLTPYLVAYLQDEERWYKDTSDGVTKIVLRFEDYVKDLPKTLEYLYEAMGEKPSSSLPQSHSSRSRRGYQINRSLSSLGIREDVIREDLRTYYEWCAPVITIGKE